MLQTNIKQQITAPTTHLSSITISLLVNLTPSIPKRKTMPSLTMLYTIELKLGPANEDIKATIRSKQSEIRNLICRTIHHHMAFG